MTNEVQPKTRADVLKILGNAFIGTGQWQENADASIEGMIAPTLADKMFGDALAGEDSEQFTAQWRFPSKEIACIAQHDTAGQDLADMMREAFADVLAGRRIARPITARIEFDLIDEMWNMRFAMWVGQAVN